MGVYNEVEITPTHFGQGKDKITVPAGIVTAVMALYSSAQERPLMDLHQKIEDHEAARPIRQWIAGNFDPRIHNFTVHELRQLVERATR